MYDNFIPSGAEYLRVLPDLILVIVATLIMVAEPLTSEDNKKPLCWLAVLGLAGGIWASFIAYSNQGPAFQGMLLIDGFGTFFRVLSMTVALLTILFSGQYLRQEKHEGGEYYALILFSVSGQSIMATSNELIMLFIGLEISSIASYVLAGYLRDDARNNESALKYFLLGSFATAFLLYGVAWIYGLTGTTNLQEIRRALSSPNIGDNMTLIGTAAALMLVGFSFKISAVPFQGWAPDVYQGAAAPVSAFLSAGPKAAAFAIMIRVFMTAFEPVAARWEPIVWIIALATMVVGNFGALLQTNVKRMLAYSSIAHAGYVLVAVTTHSEIGAAAAMFYLASYAFMNVGAFAVVAHFARKGERFVNIDDLAGLGSRQPLTAALFTVFLLSLIGVPLTGGFFGKFYIFKAAIEGNFIWLSVLGLLNSAVAAYYYLRVLVVMYFHEPGEATNTVPELSAGTLTVLVGSAVAIFILGITPSALLDFAGRSAALLK